MTTKKATGAIEAHRKTGMQKMRIKTAIEMQKMVLLDIPYLRCDSI
jgi:hypothetical protein